MAAGFVLLIGIILLFIFLIRRKRNNGQLSFENEIYSMGNTDNYNHPRSAVNKLYDIAQGEWSDECNNVTEC